MLMMLLCVDDLIILASLFAKLGCLKAKLTEKLQMSDLEE